MESEVTRKNGPVRVLLVTSDRVECGIREYGRMLMDACDPQQVQIAEFAHTSPEEIFSALAGTAGRDDVWQPEVIHLNHHAALHSGWQAEHVRRLRALGLGVVVTQHDTYETWELMQERGFRDFRGADYLFVHERVEGINLNHVKDAALWGEPLGKVMMLNQPVPVGEVYATPVAGGPPVLGLFGFDFPWKGFALAREAAALAGWEVKHVGGGGNYVPMHQAVLELSQCHATAFLYSTGNSGTSGAIRTGIAAKRPVIATRGCRQFRDLELDPVRKLAINWVDGDVDSVVEELESLAASRSYWDSSAKHVAELAERDSWRNAAVAYTGCYLELAARSREKLKVGVGE